MEVHIYVLFSFECDLAKCSTASKKYNNFAPNAKKDPGTTQLYIINSFTPMRASFLHFGEMYQTAE